MLTLPSAVRIVLATEPVDMRKSIDGLMAPTQHKSTLEKLEETAMHVPLGPVLAWLDQAHWCRT